MRQMKWRQTTKRWAETLKADLPTADKGKLYLFLIKIKQTLFSLGGGRGGGGDKYFLK